MQVATPAVNPADVFRFVGPKDNHALMQKSLR